MRIEDLEFLIEVSQSKSITLTAEKMHISQQGLSQLISRVEHDFKTTLFTRCRQGITLTEAGEMTILKAKEIIEKYNELLNNLESLSQLGTHSLTGSLTLYHSHHAAMEVIPRALKIFRRKFPDVKLKMVECAPIEAISKIREDPSTVGITNFPEAYYHDNKKISQYLNPDLCLTEICHEDLYVCIPKSWPLAKKKNITRNELGKQLMVYYDTSQYEDIVSIIFKENQEMPI
ncbi:MAG: transcriptional regulator, partial [Firmicutes bacterium]|nr:transcriptional regulator [Bacillota bacterium]